MNVNREFRTYYLTTLLGKQSLSETYLAFPLDDPGCKVVLRVFAASCLGSGYTDRHFLADGESLQELKHPHLVPVLDSGIEQGQPFIVRPYLKPGSLRKRLEGPAARRLLLPKALRLGLQLAEALSFCHEHEILHGNIRPENILFEHNEAVFWSDFGLISLANADDESANRVDAQTPSYRAPEQALGMTSFKSDQFSLGCVLYEIFTGVHPFAAQQSSVQPWESPTPPSLLESNIPEELEAALFKTLAYKPAQRYRTVAELVEALRAVPLADARAFSRLATNKVKTLSGALAAASTGVPGSKISHLALSSSTETRVDTPRASKRGPTFPFTSSDASVNYRDALTSLQIEEPGSGVSSHQDNPFEDDEESTVVAKLPEADRSVDLKVSQKSMEGDEYEDVFDPLAWSVGDKAEEPISSGGPLNSLPPTSAPIAAVSTIIAAPVSARAAKAFSTSGGRRPVLQHPVAPLRRSSVILLVLALLLSAFGFSQAYLFSGFVSEESLDALATPKVVVKTAPSPTPQPTMQPTKRPTVRPTEKPTVKPTEKPTVQPTAKPTVKPTEKATEAPTAAPTAAPIPVLQASGFTRAVSGVTATTTLFSFKTDGWVADYVVLYYTVFGGVQQSVPMGYDAGDGRWKYTMSGLVPGQTVAYSFSFQRGGIEYYYTDPYYFAGTSADSGFTQGTSLVSSTSGQFLFVPVGWTAGFVVLHYKGDGIAQQNVSMKYNSSTKRWEYTASFPTANPTISYSFTYQIDGIQCDTSWYARSFT
jgi:serine/threonine protein kinase